MPAFFLSDHGSHDDVLEPLVGSTLYLDILDLLPESLRFLILLEVLPLDSDLALCGCRLRYRLQQLSHR